MAWIDYGGYVGSEWRCKACGNHLRAGNEHETPAPLSSNVEAMDSTAPTPIAGNDACRPHEGVRGRSNPGGDGKAGGLAVTAERLYEMLVHGVATGSLVEANYCQRVISHLGGKEASRLRADNARLREANDTLVKENMTLQSVLETENEDNIALRAGNERLREENEARKAALACVQHGLCKFCIDSELGHDSHPCSECDKYDHFRPNPDEVSP